MNLRVSASLQYKFLCSAAAKPRACSEETLVITHDELCLDLRDSVHRNTDQDQNSLMVGIGAQYRLTPRLDLTLNVDHLGKVAEHQSADMVTAGMVMRF